MSPRRSSESAAIQPDMGMETVARTLEQHRVPLPARSPRRKVALEQGTTGDEFDPEDEIASDGVDLEDYGSTEGDSVRQYLNDIGQTALLSAEDEVNLARSIEAGLFAEQIIAYRENGPEVHEELKKSISKGILKRLEIEAKKAAKAREADREFEDERSPGQVLKDEDQASKERVRQAEAETVDAMARIGRLAASELSAQELREAVADGEVAKDHLIQANLRLVVRWAKRNRSSSLDLLEIISEGNIGLIRGVEKFDYTQGYKFSTYGSWWIRQAISRARADKERLIRVPVHMVEKVTKLEKVERELHEELMRVPSEVELAAALNTSVEKLRELKEYSLTTLSLDQAIGEDQGATLGEFTAYEAPVAQASVELHDMQRVLQTALQTLDGREEQVMRMRFGIGYATPLTLDEIGKEFELSRERIRQIERDAKAKLRELPIMNSLRDYLD